MNAIETRNRWKQLILCISMLLFLFSITPQSFGQETRTRISKPTGLNSWKPSFLLPRGFNSSDTPGPGLDSVVRTDFTIIMRDGVIIDALKYVPFRTVPPANGYLTVMMVHGYGDNKNTLAGFCHDQATYGYYCMTYSVRGQGNSGGLSNLISDIEALDLLEVIQWVKNDSVNGSNPGKILIMGGSQGGILPMKAACLGGRPVTTIISSVAPPNFASSWIENGSVKMTCLWTMDYTPDTARYSPQVDKMRGWIFGDTKQGWDSLAKNLPMGRDFVSSLQNCEIPVMIEGSWQDKFFNADGWMLNIDKLTCPMTSYLGAVHGHGGDISETEDSWHMSWFNNWFFQWLWDINTPILDEAKYQYASSKFPVVNNRYFTFVHDSSKTLLRNASVPLKLYLSKNGKLKTTPQSGSSTEDLNNSVKSGYSLETAINEEFKGTNFNNKFKIDSSKFTSDALTADLEWTGAPVINVEYKSSASTFCQLNYQIYEVLPGGERRFINRANFTNRNYVKNTRTISSFRGQAHSHIFKAGSKILVIITNLDRAHTDAVFFNTNPFVLPVMKNGKHNVYLNSNSYVELPIISNGTSPELAFAEENSDAISTEPNAFSLKQNYPNPFNPVTMIEYSIAKPEKVELKVFDLLGKEIATLVNNFQNPGSYHITFNASNLSSGIYFYKLVTGSFTDVKRMILIK